ncbi:VapB protein of antitoxin of type II toxin-antitoxin system [Streptomyces sp. 3211.6]|uniref:type II toxin-antitoxin system VapB family antitoxin n=1 Tax=Streptomyces TaxID=1883 RepID=UPI0009A54124|nr:MULTISPECIES: type II toxin-antitoxin system VapB family antitoxin [Streptomyces]RKT04800.1 VapB protein of antitoxin of type II toxin-antitoxin system [Streptomyces sp. 3211.6]RPF40675.1 VapB protein of antitoxin of type II toxin-antitoxin system [Streptomyces sp. Ag109_G2-6]
MSNLYVDVDDEALAEAASILGTKTKKDTVNAALLEVAKRHRRLRALERLAQMGERGDFDLLLDKENYRR